MVARSKGTRPGIKPRRNEGTMQTKEEREAGDVDKDPDLEDWKAKAFDPKTSEAERADLFERIGVRSNENLAKKNAASRGDGADVTDEDIEAMDSRDEFEEERAAHQATVKHDLPMWKRNVRELEEVSERRDLDQTEATALEGYKAKIEVFEENRTRLANPKEQKRLAHEAVRAANRLRDDALKAKEDND